jgi:spore maturation protein CgeB
MHLVVLGLSLSSSWGNGHATTYRALLAAFAARGHRVTFLERDKPWYRAARDFERAPYCDLVFYESLADLERYASLIAAADAVMVGSYVPEGVAVGTFVQRTARGVRAFYDIDTPVTLAKLRRGDHEYLSPALIPDYDVYFSFTGGPTLDVLEQTYRSPAARALYCSVDPARYRPMEVPRRYDLGYLGTYSDDRQPTLERLLVEPAWRLPDRTFVVAGPQYPATIEWPANVTRLEHVPPEEHAAFYAACRYTLNVTRADMIEAGWSPSVRLFEAAACGTPILSDRWAGLDSLFEPGAEIELVDDAAGVVAILRDTPEVARRAMAARARSRVLAGHTAAHRAERFAADLEDALAARLRRLDAQRKSSV